MVDLCVANRGAFLRRGDSYLGRILGAITDLNHGHYALPAAAWPRWLLRRRRYIGVAVFAYAFLHTLVYLDRKQTIDLILEEGADFSMWTGWLAFGIFLVLAVTSNDRMVQILRQGWKNLHRWVYLAAALTFIHWILVAFDFLPGLVHLLVLLGFELIRIWKQKTNAT